MKFAEIIVSLILLSVSLSTAGALTKVPAIPASRSGEMGLASPSTHIDMSVAPSSGRIITVTDGDDLQAALDQAIAGDVIELEAGGTFVGNFILPRKKSSQDGTENGEGWIVIRSASESDLAGPATRISPSMAPALSKVATPNTGPALSAEPGAHHYRLTGLELTMAPDVSFSYGLLRLGRGDEQELSQVPHDIVVDRCYIHGNPTAGLRRGVALNSASTIITDSYISDCHEVGADSQAICGWNGPGPFTIVNNYLEASGENVLFGGADPKIDGLIPSDIEFRGNHCAKPLAWKVDDPSYAGIPWSVKNLFELKNAQRVLVEGNLFEQCWVDAQTGYAILFKSVNQDGTAPWSTTQDVEFRNNVVRRCGAGVNIEGRAADQTGGQTKRIAIRNNLFEDIGASTWQGEGVFLKISDTEEVTIDHNTILQTGNIITAYGEPNLNVVFTNNLAPHNLYGIKGDSASDGAGTLDNYFPGVVFKKNLIAGRGGSAYPSKNFYPASLDDIGFVDLSNGNYRLSSASPYKNAGTKGKDIGADIDAIELAIRGSRTD